MKVDSYTEATLCFPIRDGKVLLAEKQRKIGAGFLNGFGGKVEAIDKDIFETNAREVFEEVGISVKLVRKVGEIAFSNFYKDHALRNMLVHIFVANDWNNEPHETEEMKKVEWYQIDDLNYDRFLAGDKLFVPQILGGKALKGLIKYDENWMVESYSIKEVDPCTI